MDARGAQADVSVVPTVVVVAMMMAAAAQRRHSVAVRLNAMGQLVAVADRWPRPVIVRRVVVRCVARCFVVHLTTGAVGGCPHPHG